MLATRFLSGFSQMPCDLGAQYHMEIQGDLIDHLEFHVMPAGF